jgi:hypothetical protein
MISSDLANELVKSHSINHITARKRISRSIAPINKINLGFENNQSFIFLSDQFGTEKYWKVLTKNLMLYSKAYYSFINSIIFHFGFINKSQISAYSFSPIKKLKRHLNASNIINNLQKHDIIQNVDEDIFQLNSNLFKQNNFHRFRAIEIAKNQVIIDFLHWARTMNLISYNTGECLNERAEFCKFQWGFTSPSYINGITEFKDGKIKPGFIVADILIGRKLREIDIEFFISKIATIKQQKKASAFIPFLICDNIENSAFKKVKSKGIVIGFIEELFGSTYSKTLQLLIDTITDATKVVTSDPNQFLDLIKKLSALEGKFGNIKGDMFELVVGYFYSIENKPIVISKSIKERESEKSVEIDVFVNATRQLRIVECKGLKSPLGLEYVEYWLNDRVPVIRKWILSQDDYKSKEVIFEIWSTSGFEDNALHLLQSQSNSIKPSKYKVKFFDKPAIVKKFKETKNTKLQEVLKQYY